MLPELFCSHSHLETLEILTDCSHMQENPYRIWSWLLISGLTQTVPHLRVPKQSVWPMGKGQEEKEPAGSQTQISGTTHISDHYLNPGFLPLEMKYICPGIPVKPTSGLNSQCPQCSLTRSWRLAGWCDYANSTNWLETASAVTFHYESDRAQLKAPRDSVRQTIGF